MSIKSGVRVFFHGLLVLVAFIVSSCTSDGLTEETAGQEATATLRLTFKLADDAVTRALSDNENTVNNVMILIFDSNEQLIGSKYVYGLSTTTSTTATVTTRVAAGCTVYAIANTGSASYFSGINTIENLNAKSTSIIGAAALGEGTNTIMAGSTPVNITAGTNSIDVPIKHLCSKLNFSIVPSSGITITGYRLCNAALGSYIIGSHTSAGITVTPPVNSSGDSYGNFDAVTLSSPTAGTTVTPPVYYVYENLAGSNSNCTTEQLRTEANAPAHAMYLEVYAKTSSWHSVYYIYLGGMTNASTPVMDLSNFNVYRNMNYTYTININGSGQSDARVTYVADNTTQVNGQFLFSDGTWGDYDDNKTVIGIIFATSTSSTDQGHNYTHGYAMALKNAGSSSTPYQWCTSNGVNPTGTNLTAANQIMGDKNGYTHTEKIKTTGYAAGIAATGYVAKDKNENTVIPTGTSGWYLPSIGQWYDICVNLGGMVTASEKPYTNSDTGWLRWYSEDDSSGKNYSSLCASAINVYLSALSTKGYSVDLFANSNEYYWSSSEYSSKTAYRAYFYSGGNMYLGHTYKTLTGRVRPVVAF